MTNIGIRNTGPASIASRESKGGPPDVMLLATGSEVGLAVAAYEQLTSEGVKVRVVSMPCWELFEQESEEYQNEVLPPNILARVSIEQSAKFGWEKYVGLTGASIGMKTFGASAPLQELQKLFGFTLENVVATAKQQLAKTTG